MVVLLAALLADGGRNGEGGKVREECAKCRIEGTLEARIHIRGDIRGILGDQTTPANQQTLGLGDVRRVDIGSGLGQRLTKVRRPLEAVGLIEDRESKQRESSLTDERRDSTAKFLPLGERT